MASLVQSNVGTLQGTGNSLGVAYSGSNAAGNLLVAKLWVGSNNTISTFSDSAGNTWVQQRNDTESAINTNLYSYYCLNAKAGANTVNVVFSATTYAALYIAEASGGAGTTWSTDGTTATLSSSPGTAVDSGAITTVGTNDIIFAQILMSPGETPTAGTGYTIAQSDVFSNCMEYQTVTSAGTYHATATLSASTNWYCDITAFKATGGGSVSPSVSGTISVTGVVSPILTPIAETLSGNISVSGSANPQLALFPPSLSGTISVSGQINPTIIGPITPTVSGTISVSGQVNPVFSPVSVFLSGVIGVSGAVFPALFVPPIPPVPPTPPVPSTGVPRSIGLLGRFDMVVNSILRSNPETIVEEASTGNLYLLRTIQRDLLVSTQDPRYNPGLRLSDVEYLVGVGTISWITPGGGRKLLYTILTTQTWTINRWVPKE